MLVHRRVTPSCVSTTCLYPWVERGNVRGKCEHNTMSRQGSNLEYSQGHCTLNRSTSFKYKSRHFLPACLPFLHLFHLLQLHMYISFQSDLRFSQNRFLFLQETNKNKENHDNDSVWIDREFLLTFLYFSSFSFVIFLIEEIKQKLEIMFDQSASHLEGGQKYSGTYLFSTLFSVFQNVVNCDHLCLMHYVKLALQKLWAVLCSYVTPKNKIKSTEKGHSI